MLNSGSRCRAAIAAGLVIAATMVPIRSAHACACCAEPGARYDKVETIDSDARDLIASLKFGRDAQLYSTAADWEEQIRGIVNPDKSYDYQLEPRRKGRRLILRLRDKQGNRGKLVIGMPKKVRKFQVDRKPQLRTSGGSRIKLYKEWRLRTRNITGNGIFTFKKSRDVLAQLIFHGEGNGCTFAEQFTHWTLDVEGPKARFRFFGRLAKSN